MNPAPGFAKHPDHTIEIEPAGHPVSILVDGEEIATSDHALVMKEASYPPVYYIPAEDIPGDLLAASDHKSHCPFKGDASYWDLLAGSERAENAVWSYRSPYDEVSAIKGHMAFYGSAATIRPG